MPTYDYECRTCGHVFEYFQSMSDDPLKECPKCGNEVKRLIGGGMGIIFKGSGFYVTDNRTGGGGKEKTAAETSPPKKSTEDSAKKADKSGTTKNKSA